MIFATVVLISDATLIFRKESRLRKQTLAAWTERPTGEALIFNGMSCPIHLRKAPYLSCIESTFAVVRDHRTRSHSHVQAQRDMSELD